MVRKREHIRPVHVRSTVPTSGLSQCREKTDNGLLEQLTLDDPNRQRSQTMESADLQEQTGPELAWTPLPEIERRVVGVLVEKAKTTSDQYPLSMNALMNGCNQKSNRDPKMDVDADDVEDALESLRQRSAVGEIHGGGRVAKYRHYLKDWLGVDGTELAVMAELLLRGSQSVGDLRGRAARMAAGQLPDLSALRPVLASLIAKGLVVALTPEGRGQFVTHALYEPGELETVRGQAAAMPQPQVASTAPPVAPRPAPATAPSTATPSTPSNQVSAGTSDQDDDVANLHKEVADLRAEVARLSKEVEDLWSNTTS